MSNLTTGTAANVLVGPARMLVAPFGSTLPTLDGTVDPVVWDAAFKEVGYTDAGTDLAYNPTLKDVLVDEEMAAVRKILDAEKCVMSAKLAEVTLTNLNRAISASLWTHHVADGTHAEYETLEVGSGAPVEMVVGFEGKSPAGFQRIVIGRRAIAQANIAMSFKRGDKLIIPCEFGLLADSAQAAGKRLFIIYDKKASNTSTLVSIALTPNPATVDVGDLRKLTATATYSGGAPTADISDLCTWVSSVPAKATVDSHGMVTGVATGTSDITAAFGGVTSPTDTVTVEA